MQFRAAIGDPPLHRLLFRKGGAEHLPLRRIVGHHVERALRRPDRPGRHFHPARAEAHLHRPKARSFLAEQLPALDAAILQRDFIGIFAAQHGDAAQHVEAGRVLVHEERRHGPRFGIGHRHQDREVRFGGARDPDLAPVDDPVARTIVRFHRARFHAARVRARAGLRNTDGGYRLAAGIGRQIRLDLLVLRRRDQHAQIGTVGGQVILDRRRPERGIHRDQRHIGQSHAAHLLRRVERPEPHLLRNLVEPRLFLRQQLPALALRIAGQHGGFQRIDFLAHEALGKVGEHPVLFVEFEIHGPCLGASAAPAQPCILSVARHAAQVASHSTSTSTASSSRMMPTPINSQRNGSLFMRRQPRSMCCSSPAGTIRNTREREAS